MRTAHSSRATATRCHRRENIITDRISIAGLPILLTLTRSPRTDSSNCRSRFKFLLFSERRADFTIAAPSPMMRPTWTVTVFPLRTISTSAGTILSRHRFSKWFRLGDRYRLEALIEFFNTLNRSNPSQIQTAAEGPVRFGTVTQVLPGREGQVGIRIEF